MDEDFSNYNQASALKDLGFDKPCLGYWSNWGTQEPFLLTCELGTEKESCSIKRKNLLCKTPTFSQAFRWFREKYGLYYKIHGYSNNTSFVFDIADGDFETYYDECPTYEQAESACLDKLIELVKNGKGINN